MMGAMPTLVVGMGFQLNPHAHDERGHGTQLPSHGFISFAMPTAVALFSGGLDSMLAIRVIQEQGFDVEALNVRTTFDCCQTPAAKAAADLGVRMTVLAVEDDYLDLIRRPTHGYGRGVNPCIDCRIYLCQMAKRFMEQLDACVVITGEIAGQRPASQKSWHLNRIALESGLEGRLLRPLSALLLAPTQPERTGLIDREKLYGFHGRGRGPLIDLAGRFGIHTIPQPSTGCALTEVSFAPRVRDLMHHHPQATRWEFELLNTGRHIRLDPTTKIVVGRSEEENALLELFHTREDAPDAALLCPDGFGGPDILLLGRVTDDTLNLAAAFILRYARQYDPQMARIRVDHGGTTRWLAARSIEPAQTVVTL